MTEEQWLKTFNGPAMLAVVRDRGSDRLWRLLAVACARVLEDRMRYRESRHALEVAERFADGEAPLGELRRARALAEAAAREAHHDAYEAEEQANFCSDAAYEAVWAAMRAADAALPCVAEVVDPNSIPEGLLLPNLLREIFGNPFRWVTVSPACLAANDSAALMLARTLYERRVFDDLPILADALEDAGCTDDTLLAHLRSPGPYPHVRGCWAVDLILDKS
jgi:hypothetical protein